MNTEVIKAMNKKEKKNTFRKWWSKNGYKVMRVIFFPIWGCMWVKGKIDYYLNSKCDWSEERAHKILSYYIPRKAEWCEEDKTFYFFDNGMGWRMKCNKHKIKLKDRRFWNNYNGFWGGKIRTYLIDEFELEGFNKKLGDCGEGWTEISFTLIEK